MNVLNFYEKKVSCMLKNYIYGGCTTPFGNRALYLLWRALCTEADRDIYILFPLISAIFSVSIDIGM